MKTRFPIGSRVFSFSAIPFSKNKYLCISYNRIMLDYKYNTLRLAFLLAAIMLVAPCCKQKSNPTTQQIELVKRQVSADRETLHEIESVDYPQLEDDFYHCDSMLQYVDQETAVQQFDKLNLAKAYLIQFQETLPRMQADIDSSLLQLDRLEADANSHYLSDSLVLVYLQEEKDIANRLHEQVLYFKDRLGNSRKKLDILSKH